MNIFVTDASAKICALSHCDRHLVKMIVETAQMLATAHWILDNKIVEYKPTHWGHPCSVWIRESSENYQWSVNLLSELCSEYTVRYKKRHKTEGVLPALSKAPGNIPIGPATNWAQAMPEEFMSRDSIESYRDYLVWKYKEWMSREKVIKVCWTSRGVPSWVLDHFDTKSVYRSDGRVTIQLVDKTQRAA